MSEGDNPSKQLKNIHTMGNLQRSINRSLETAQNSERTYLPGETKSTNHLIFEMNEFYLEMAQKIKELKLNRYDTFEDEEDKDVEDTDSMLYEVVTAIRKKRNDPAIRKQIETVLKLDQMMEESFRTLKEERLERQRVQKQLCEIIDKEDDKYAKSRFFKDLCDSEEGKLNSSDNSVNQSGNEAEKCEEIAKLRSQTASKKNDKFIQRNIQLAKNTPMMSNPVYSLTDEEKVKLDKLLIDLDKIPQCDSELDETNLTNLTNFTDENDQDHDDYLSELDEDSTVYPFSLSQQDQMRMLELESELENLSQVSLLSSKQKSAHHQLVEGRTWQNEDRLKQIDEKLEKLQREREAFQFEFEPIEVAVPLLQAPPPSEILDSDNENVNDNDIDNDDTANDVESISYDTIRERSQELLQRIACIQQQKSSSDEDDDESVAYSDHEHDEPERD